MKTPTTSSHSTIRIAAALLACALAAAIPAAGCQDPGGPAIDEAAAPGDPTGSAQLELKNQPPGAEDQIGELRIDEQILYVVEGEQDQALLALNAEATGDGTYLLLDEGLEFTMQSVPNWGWWWNPQYVCSCGGYKIYKNAQCAPYDAGYCTVCTNDFGGTSSSSCYFTRSTCQKGSGYCVSRTNAIVAVSYEYDNWGCAGPVINTWNVTGEACN